MAPRQRLFQFACGIAFFANLSVANATPITYHADLFNTVGGNVLEGSGFFTVDTAGQSPSGICSSNDCLTNFDFTVGSEGWKFGSAGGLIQFLADAQGLITDYGLLLAPGTLGDVLAVADVPFAATITWNVTNANGIVSTCDGNGAGCVVTKTVPEPTTLSLLGLSLVGFGWWQRKRA